MRGWSVMELVETSPGTGSPKPGSPADTARTEAWGPILHIQALTSHGMQAFPGDDGKEAPFCQVSA